MNQPVKGEQAQIDSLYRQLRRLEQSSDNLYRKMAINGRSSSYYERVQQVSLLAGHAANQLKKVVSDANA